MVNLTPADVYLGRAEEVKDKREEIKQKTLNQRRQLNRHMAPNTSFFGMANPLLVFRPLCPKGSDDVQLTKYKNALDGQ